MPYNTPHTVSVVATNCAGSSAATETVINIGELFFVDVCDYVHVYIPTHTHTHTTIIYSWLCCSSVTSEWRLADIFSQYDSGARY